MASGRFQRALRELAFHGALAAGRVRGTLRGLASAPTLAAAPQEVMGKRKSYLRRLADNLWWSLRYGTGEPYYNQYGLDLVGAPMGDYLDERTFSHTRAWMNHPSLFGQCDILDDKRLFAIYMEQLGFPVPQSPGVLEVGADGTISCLTLALDEPLELDCLDFPLYVKAVGGRAGDGLFLADTPEEVQGLPLTNGHYLLQEPLIQAEGMRPLGPFVNTIRVGTYLLNGERGCFGATVRASVGANHGADKIRDGAIAVGVVGDDGQLAPTGVSETGYPLPLDSHPETGLRFADFKIPRFREALELCYRVHASIPEIVTVGWDVAIGVDGPAIIEGNSDWAMRLIQDGVGGIRAQWLDVWNRWRATHTIETRFI